MLVAGARMASHTKIVTAADQSYGIATQRSSKEALVVV